MSGGVDSAVTAYLLQKDGYECCGCTMKLYDADELTRGAGDNASCNAKTCCSLKDVEDAKSVAAGLGMEHYVLNFKREFDAAVIQSFVEAYQRGETPNPCIECNRTMKFDLLLERARQLGFDGIATGHYARITFEDGRYHLLKAGDPAKDQSYVLYSLTQEQLAHVLFPLGDMHKDQVRQIAGEQGFVNARKHDSQDICFVPDGDYAGMIERYTGESPQAGNFVNREGHVIARHRGIIHYTIGQRRGLGIPADRRLYVVEIRPETNEVVLGDDEDLFLKKVYVKNFHYIAGEDQMPASFRGSCKVRYRHKEQPCSVEILQNGDARITFDQPQRAITPGQTAVVYDGEEVLGGGLIRKSEF